MDEVDEAPILGRVKDEEGWELDNTSPEVALVEVNADLRSVCRLFWNQTVTDRNSLYDPESSEQRVISDTRISRGSRIKNSCGGNESDLQLAFVRETFALFSGRVAGFVEELLELHDLGLSEAFPGSFDFVSWDWRGSRIVRGHARDGARARQGGVHGSSSAREPVGVTV